MSFNVTSYADLKKVGTGADELLLDEDNMATDSEDKGEIINVWIF